MGFTRAELESFRGRSVDDLMPEHPRLVFVGINPGLWTAATGTHFAHPGNRFYPALADRLYGSNPERAAEFAKMLDSPDRIIIEVTPGLRVGYDGAKMAAATTRSREAGVLKNL